MAPCIGKVMSSDMFSAGTISLACLASIRWLSTPWNCAVAMVMRAAFMAASLCIRFRFPQLLNIKLKSSSFVSTGQRSSASL